jgi:hypothetical protein
MEKRGSEQHCTRRVSTEVSTAGSIPTIVSSQLLDLSVIVILVLTGSQLLPKQMLYQAELHPDRAAEPIRFATECN